MKRNKRLERLREDLSDVPSKAVYSLGIAFATIGAGLFLIGFIVSLSAEDKLRFITAGLAFFSAGLGLLAYRLGLESRQRTRAISNADFHEKIAMMYKYMGIEQDRIKHDLEAALELREWIKEDVKKEFLRACECYIDKAKNDGDDALCSKLQEIYRKCELKPERRKVSRLVSVLVVCGSILISEGVGVLEGDLNINVLYGSLIGVVIILVVVAVYRWSKACGAREVEKNEKADRS